MPARNFLSAPVNSDSYPASQNPVYFHPARRDWMCLGDGRQCLVCFRDETAVDVPWRSGYQRGHMMNISTMLVIGFMVISGCIDANSIMAADMPSGTLRLAENSDGSGDSCSLTTKDNTYYNMEFHGCKNDQMSFFKLDTVPSATEIQFDSEKCSGSTHRWTYTIKTIVHPISTRWISFAELKDAQVDEIVVKGVRLISRQDDGGVSPKGKLSCVKTRPSPQP